MRLNSEAASRYLLEQHSVVRSPKTLEKIRCTGGGPAFRKFGRSVLYEATALDAWVLQHLERPRRSTSDTPEADAA